VADAIVRPTGRTYLVRAHGGWRTFFTRVAMADLRDLLYTRAFSDVLCRCSEFCLASTWNTVARTGAGRREAAWRHGYDHHDHDLRSQASWG